MKRVTLSDIAQQAKVHVTTVSMALRDHPRIPGKTKDRIKKIADALGYAPDPVLSALSTYRTRSRSPRYQSTIGYLTNWESEWGWKAATGHLDFFTGAENAAQELGFKLEHFWLGQPHLTDTRLSKVLKSRGINGLILASHGRERGDILNLEWNNFSAVKIDYFPHKPLVHNITNHQSDIIRLAMRKAIRYGYKRIGFVMHRGWNVAVDQNWMAGFLCQEQDILKKDRVPAYIYPNKTPIEKWLGENVSILPDTQDFQKWYDRHKPDVIISNSAFIRNTFQEVSIKCPDDVAFIDIFLSDTSGKVAGVYQNHKTVGALAVEIISSHISHNKRGIPKTPTSTFVEGTWFDGATCPNHSKTTPSR